MKNKKIMTAFLAILLLAVMVLPFLYVSAANRETVYQTSFETEEERSGWSFIDGDCDGKNWIVEKSTASGYESKDGEWLMYSSSKDVTGLDNYAISPKIELPSIGENKKFPNLRLSWYVGADSQYLPNEKYSVYVYDASSGAVSSSNITSATEIKSEVLSEGGYKNYKYCTADLEEYSGKTVQIVFRHHDCDQQVLKIDLIKVEQYFSQKDDIFTETFENGDFNAKWMKCDRDGDGFCWNASSIGANNGSYSVASKSYFINELNSDNFLISPTIEVGDYGNLQATWFAGGTDKDCFNEHYTVYAYFGEETEASKIAEECVASTNCSSAEFTLEAYKFREYGIDLDTMLGTNESFRLVFRHHNCTGSFRSLLLDDISVTGVPKYQIIASGSAEITAPNFDTMASGKGQNPEKVKMTLNNVSDEAYSVEYNWYKSDDLEKKEISSFNFGEKYSVDVKVTINSSKYLFADNFTVENAENLSVSETEVSFTVSFEAVNRKTVEVSVEQIDYALGKEIVAPEITAENCEISDGAWMASVDNDAYSAVTEKAFLPNKYYKFSCDVKANKGYILSDELNSDNITLKNGELSIVYSPLDPLEIESIAVSGITAPAIGEAPAVGDIAIEPEPEGSLSIGEGVKWIEVGNEEQPIESFEAEKAYALIIPIKVNELYAVDTETIISLSENIEASKVELENNVITITFGELKPIEIEKIIIDVTAPRAGKSPNNEPLFTKVYPEKALDGAKISGEWQVKAGDENYAAMAEGDSFVLSEEVERNYRYVLTVESNSAKYSVENAEIYISGDKVSCDEDGKYIKEFGKADYLKITFDTVGGITADGRSGKIVVFAHPSGSISAPNNLEKTGYAFNGWTDSEDSSILVTIPEKIESDLTYYAIYKPNQYTITFENTGDSTVDAITQDYGTNVTAPAQPTKTGYTWAGWDTEIPATMPANSLTIKGQWNINQYTITFENTGDSTADAITQDYGTAVTAPAQPTKTGYTWAGWDTEIPATMPANSLTIKGQWNINQYTITFENTGDSTVDAITQDYGTAVTAPAQPTKTGYTWAGWDTEIPATMPANSLTIKGQWNINQYTITFENTGDSTVDAITQDYNSTVTLPAAPEKAGYTFAGWKRADKTVLNAGDTFAMPVGGASFTAVYEANIYNAVFDANDGAWADGDTTKTVRTAFNEKIIVPTAPTKTGYIFSGWDVEPDTMDDVNGKVFTAQYKLSAEAKPEISGYVRERTEKYKTTIKFYADYGTIPNGANVHWFINGADKGVGSSYSVENATADFTVQIKLINGSGETLHESKTEMVKIKNGFFDKIVAFFQGLFGNLPNVVQK